MLNFFKMSPIVVALLNVFNPSYASDSQPVPDVVYNDPFIMDSNQKGSFSLDDWTDKDYRYYFNGGLFIDGARLSGDRQSAVDMSVSGTVDLNFGQGTQFKIVNGMTDSAINFYSKKLKIIGGSIDIQTSSNEAISGAYGKSFEIENGESLHIVSLNSSGKMTTGIGIGGKGATNRITLSDKLSILGFDRGIRFSGSEIYIKSGSLNIDGKEMGIGLGNDGNMDNAHFETNDLFKISSDGNGFCGNGQYSDVSIISNKGNIVISGNDNAVSIQNNNEKLGNFTLHAKQGLIDLTGSNGALVTSNFNLDVKAKAMRLTMLDEDFFEDGSALYVRWSDQSNIATNTFFAEARGNNKSIYALYDASIDIKSVSSTLLGHVEAKKGNIKINTDTLNLQGNVLANSNSTINIHSNQSTNFVGATYFGHLTSYGVDPTQENESNAINLTFGKNSNWNLTDNSELTSLSITQSTLDFVKPFSSEGKQKSVDFITLKTESFKAKDSTLKMHAVLNPKADANTQNSADRLIVSNSATGNLLVDIDIVGSDADLSRVTYMPYWMLSQGEGSSLTLHNAKNKNTYSGSGMVSVWALSFVKDGEEHLLDTTDGLTQLAQNNTGKGKGKWYLIRADREDSTLYPENNSENNSETNRPEDPAEMQQLLDLGISNIQAISFMSELDDLRSRTGEVRHGVSDGAWVRVSYQKDRIGERTSKISQKTHDLHLGFDHLVRMSDSSNWLLGGALRYAKAEQKGFSQFSTTGDLEQYSAKLYATYLNEGGSYTDFVVQVGRYNQEIDGIANNGYSKFGADYTTYGYGLSAELGHQFLFGINQSSSLNTFIEPQLQLSYFMANGKDFMTSTGMRVTQSDADFLTGRLGIVLGNTFQYGSIANLHSFQFAFSGGMKYEFLGDQTVKFTGVEGISKTRKADDVQGARFYYGITCDWEVRDSIRAYAKLEREEGRRYTKDFDVSLGVRYQF